MWLLPTKGRPHQVGRFFEQWRKTAASTPGILIVNEDDRPDVYSLVNLPSNWKIVTVNSTCVADAVNTVLMTLGEQDWIGLLCDDLSPETMEWDRLLIERSKPWNIVASQNGSQEQRLHGALVYGGDLLRAVGWMYPPGIKHSFHDDAWELIGDRCLNIVKVPEVMVCHVHAGTVDETGRKRNSYWNDDEKAWLKWRRDESNEVIKRVVSLMRESGANVDAPDIGERSLMILSPCYAGTFNRLFLRSLQKTLDLLRALNIKVEFSDAPFIAEPGYARALMLGRFLRSPYTDLLMIDDDMGWSERDVLRLLNAKMDLVAVAGPRKIDVPAVAGHITREDANAVLTDARSGALSLTEVGGAFLMISRACAEKVVAANGDLTFDAEHGATEHDVFRNMIVMREGKRVRLSEDYSFCCRARQVGIRTMVIPDISLEHAGTKVWRCSLNDILKNPVIPEALEAAE